MSQAHIQYHPQIGYTYVPNLRMRMPSGDGGYLLRTNAAGFRSDREFVTAREPGVARGLLFGDSQTAGDGVSNRRRYSDRLDALLPDCEIYNLGVSATGTDQQYLVYSNYNHFQHDFVIIGFFVENIKRIVARALMFYDQDGLEVFYPKPYFDYEGGELVLRQVPVPKQPWRADTLPADIVPHVYRFTGVDAIPREIGGVLRRVVPFRAVRRMLKKVVFSMTKAQPLGDYASPDAPAWVLLRAILERWIRESPVPVLTVPIPPYLFIEGSVAANGYQDRLSELAADTGCHVFDPLPAMMALSETERRGLWSEQTGHLSVAGHECLAELMAPAVRSLLARSAADVPVSSRVDPAPLTNGLPDRNST